MKAEGVLTTLRKRGASVRVVGDRIRAEGPVGAVTPGLRAALEQQKLQILEVLRRERSAPRPTVYAAVPSPPQPTDGDEIALARVRFAQHGTQAAWDDLHGAAQLERQRTWCQETLEAVYRGQLTLFFGSDGRVSVFPRSLAS